MSRNLTLPEVTVIHPEMLYVCCRPVETVADSCYSNHNALALCNQHNKSFDLFVAIKRGVKLAQTFEAEDVYSYLDCSHCITYIGVVNILEF